MIKILNTVLAGALFLAGVVEASPSWTLYDDDKGTKTEFALDPSKLCTDPKKAEALDFGPKVALVPAEVRDAFIDVIAISSDSRQIIESNRAFCKLAIMMANSGCDTDKIKIISRLKTRKLGQVNEGPKGKKYVSEFMIHGCSKLPEGKVASNCVYPMKEGETLRQPMEISAYATFISRCYADLYAIGGPYSSDVEIEDTKAALTHITRDPTVAIR